MPSVLDRTSGPRSGARVVDAWSIDDGWLVGASVSRRCMLVIFDKIDILINRVSVNGLTPN
jgi:hypothetical protein